MAQQDLKLRRPDCCGCAASVPRESCHPRAILRPNQQPSTRSLKLGTAEPAVVEERRAADVGKWRPKGASRGDSIAPLAPARVHASHRPPQATTPPCRPPNGRRIPDPESCGAAPDVVRRPHPRSVDLSPARRPCGVLCVLPWLDVTDAADATTAHDADQSAQWPHLQAPASEKRPPSQPQSSNCSRQLACQRPPWWRSQQRRQAALVMRRR